MTVVLFTLCYVAFMSDCALFFFFFKQKTAYEMRISDWSSDVCSSDLSGAAVAGGVGLVVVRSGVQDRRRPIGIEQRILALGERGGRNLLLQRTRTRRRHFDVRQVAHVLALRVILAMLLARGVPVAFRAGEARSLALADGVEMESVVARLDRKSTRLNSSH